MDALHRPSVADDKPTPSTFVDGSVSATDPLEVVLDGIGPVAALTLVDEAALAPGDRVRCELAGRRVIVHGIAGGRARPGYLLMAVVRYTSSGTFSKADYPGARAVRVTAQGAGASGGGSVASTGTGSSHGGGGGAGGSAESFIPIENLSDEEIVTVGAGGAAPSVGGAGNNGGTSSFGSHTIATGGAGGIAGLNTVTGIARAGGAGGIGTAGDILLPGGAGQASWGVNARAYGGQGGDARFGAGGVSPASGSDPQTIAGNPGRGYGAGGSGSCNTGAASGNSGGAGADGIVIVEVYA